MNFLKGIAFALFFALLFVSSASSLQLYSNSDHVSIRGTEGKVYFWITNTDGIARTASFSADLGGLNGFFEDDGVIVPERGAKGTWLKFWAPLCFRGTERIGVKADVCDANGRCEALEKSVLVAANPPERCSIYDDSRVAVDSFVPPRSYGDGSFAWSTVAYSSRFDPTDFEAEISGSDYCIKIKPGETARRPFTVINRGAASTFELRTVGAENEISSYVSPRAVSLRRGESKEVWIEFLPERVEGGRRYVSLQVSHSGQVLAENPVCVEVDDVFEGQVRLPQKVSGKQCEEISFNAIVENTGTSRDSFAIEIPKSSQSTPEFVQLNAGEKALFAISIPADSLKAGENAFLVTAKSSARGLFGQAEVKIQVDSCTATAPVQSVETRSDNVLDISVSITNAFSETLKNVTAEIEGIPSQWKVESSTVSSIGPGETATLFVKITQTTSEEALSPVLVIKSEGREIARKPLQAIKPSGLTGLFTSVSQNSLLLALLIIAALVAVVLFSRGKQSQSAFPGNFKEKLRAIKRAASK